jgi:hypothetical protein
MADENDELGIVLSETDPVLPPGPMLDYLRRCGFPISKSWYEKLHAENQGPPVDCYWGRTPMRKRSTARKWAQDRVRQSTKKRSVSSEDSPTSARESGAIGSRGSADQEKTIRGRRDRNLGDRT